MKWRDQNNKFNPRKKRWGLLNCGVWMMWEWGRGQRQIDESWKAAPNFGQSLFQMLEILSINNKYMYTKKKKKLKQNHIFFSFNFQC